MGHNTSIYKQNILKMLKVIQLDVQHFNDLCNSCIQVHDTGSWWQKSGSYTSLPLVSPFSIHSTVTLSLSSCSDVTIAWCIRPAERGCKEMLGLFCAAWDCRDAYRICCFKSQRQTLKHPMSHDPNRSLRISLTDHVKQEKTFHQYLTLSAGAV